MRLSSLVIALTRRGIVAMLAAAAMLAGMLPLAAAPALPEAGAGRIRLMRTADIPFERYSVSPTPAEITFMNRWFDRMMVYRPYFDSRLRWYPAAWFYQNSYALYPEAKITHQHPEWILRDKEGRRLYIPWGCAHGTCPAFAANIFSPAYRAWWIEQAREGLAAGYRGIFIDDVSLTRRVSDGRGEMVAPIDPVTGRPIGKAAWAQGMAAFMEQVRRALPGTEIVHNGVWFYGAITPGGAAVQRRQITAADYSMMEFGVTDQGVGGGTGPYSLASLMTTVDLTHAAGRGVILGGTPPDAAGRTYAVGCYLLVTDGRDFIADDNVTPDDPKPIYRLALGAVQGARYRWHGMWRRDFAGGSVVVNPPDGPAQPLAGLPGRQWDGTALPTSLPPRAAVIVTPAPR